MRIIPIEIEYDWWFPNHVTFVLRVLHFDGYESSTSLFEIGLYQGEFVWDVLFSTWFARKYEQWLDNKNA